MGYFCNFVTFYVVGAFITGNGHNSCPEMISKVQIQDGGVLSPNPVTVQDVTGFWVSKSCEVHPGPEFLVRAYRFHRNGTFVLRRYYYGNIDCSGESTYGVSSTGWWHPFRVSLLVPGATETKFHLSKVRVTAYNSNSASRLESRGQYTCSRPSVRGLFVTYETMTSSDEDEREAECLESMSLEFLELLLVRVERRTLGMEEGMPGRLSVSLLLGRTRAGDGPLPRYRYQPTSFQMPLVGLNSVTACDVCRNAATSSTTDNPPVITMSSGDTLRASVHYKALEGEWVSTGCELRPHGLFVRRRLRFSSTSVRDPVAAEPKWRSHFAYFSDHTCSSSGATLEVEVWGNWTLLPGDLDDKAATGLRASRGDFWVRGAAVTPMSESTARALRGSGCVSKDLQGRLWEVGRRTLVITCPDVGVKVPSVEYETFRLVVDGTETPYFSEMLYLGDNGVQSAPNSRPTSFQPALVRCSSDGSNVDGPFQDPQDALSISEATVPNTASHPPAVSRCSVSLFLSFSFLFVKFCGE